DARQFDSSPTSKAQQRGQIESLLQERRGAAIRLSRLDRQIERIAIESICGENDLRQVEKYDGTLGLTGALVDRVQARSANSSGSAILPVSFWVQMILRETLLVFAGVLED